MTLTHLLDTGWIVRHLRGDTAYTESIARIGAGHLAVSVISVGELFEGVFRASDPVAAEHALDLFLSDKTVLPVGEDLCRLFGDHRARLRRGNELIGDLDLLIGITCLHHYLGLLTTNPKHFQRLPGLTVISTPSP